MHYKKNVDLEVMGVSRSGRVRKKSSKLMDFQSPDDIETKLKKHSVLKSNQVPRNAPQTNIGLSPGSDDYASINDAIKVEPDLDLNMDISDSGDLSDDSEDIDDSTDDSNDQNEMEMEENWPVSPNTSLIKPMNVESAPNRSLYMSEKSSKKRVVINKDGKITMAKAHRKDKGKSRFTAYMLWAKDVRQEMLYTNPELDFSSISKKLGEMWANVPSSEKYNWKRRAKRLASKGKTLQNHAMKREGNVPKFINKDILNRNNSPKASESSEDQKPVKRQTTQIAPASTYSALAHSTKSPTSHKHSVQQPAEIAAYLKLLGDNLTIIGERLKEHEGQITVSGSLSVLLDSILCSIGPLMCLTNQIPNLGPQSDATKEHLANILDNIAYVMPGL